MHIRSNRLRPSHNHRFLRSIDRSIVPFRAGNRLSLRGDTQSRLLSFVFPLTFDVAPTRVSPYRAKRYRWTCARFFERKRVKRGKLLYNWYRGKDFKGQAFLERGRNRAFEDADVRSNSQRVSNRVSRDYVHTRRTSRKLLMSERARREKYTASSTRRNGTLLLNNTHEGADKTCMSNVYHRISS